MDGIDLARLRAADESDVERALDGSYVNFDMVPAEELLRFFRRMLHESSVADLKRLRSANEDDVEAVRDGCFVALADREAAELLEFYHRMLDVVTGEPER